MNSSQKPEWLKKNKECYEKVHPKGVPFPTDTMNSAAVKKFVCQPGFKEVGPKAEACAKQPKEEMDEEEKKVVECMKQFAAPPPA